MKNELSKIGLVLYYIGAFNRRNKKLIIWHPITLIYILLAAVYFLILSIIEDIKEDKDFKEHFTFKIK